MPVRPTRAALAAILWTLAFAPNAAAMEFFDGRVEVHGFYEAQVRSIVRDYDFSDDWDLTQWWNILNVEMDASIAPDGFGPFDLVTMFVRIEVRYDCVWTGACTIFDSADAYRMGHNRRLPKRLMDARRTGFSTNVFVGDRRHFYDVEQADLTTKLPDDPKAPSGSRNVMSFAQSPFGGAFFSVLSNGPDGVVGTPDDIGPFLFDTYLSGGCDEWGARSRPGSSDGRSAGESLPLNPSCEYDTIGELRGKPNPYRAGDFNPIIGQGGSGALPYRPAARLAAGENSPRLEPQGIYYPNYRLQQLLRDSEFDRLDNSLSRSEVAWNHGSAQQDQGELKELYFDVEMLDSRLWMRVGYQTIVWGKTELFRNQDQFNPSDLALSSLTSLEESRISLWALRAIWSFYDVGPLQDVRFEVAMNYDQYQANDFGLCGEPYTALAACALSFGQMAHGITGIGLAGAIQPPDAWNSWKGIEAGARIEWRWDRFSFAVSDFYGYMDTPYASRLFTYSRNVDPRTGRPRHTETTGSCRTGRESSCLRSEDALLQHSANQQTFALTCMSSLALVADLDPTACFANIFGSPARTPDVGPIEGPRVVVALNMVLSGDSAGAEGLILPGLAGFTDETNAAIAQHTYDGRSKVTVFLNRDVNDGPIDHPPGHPLVQADDYPGTVAFFQVNLGGSISDKLTNEQEALLGCGAFYETSCDLDGVDLLNMEAGVVFQSFPNVSGTQNWGGELWDTTDAGVAQPGTVGFQGEPLCTRYENGKTYILPGCRGPDDPGYDPRVDGTVTGLLHPFTGQQFSNELAAASWNTLMGLVGFSPAGEDGVQIADFDPANPFREGGCSFRQPQWCFATRALLAITGLTRNSIRAGGNYNFGRRDFLWHAGGDVVLRTEKANVLGFSMDWAEDVTKSNWGIEFTWWDSVPAGNADEFDGISDVSLYRLTISVDRPTFVNFLNANRTFFVNTQWFFQWTDGWHKGVGGDGPWSVFGVFAVATGYFQDRLLTSATFVYFVMNNSLAFLPQVTYRFNESFSVTVGLAAFAGRERAERQAINPLALSGGFGRNAYSSFTEPGLAVIRERDEIFLRLRYTF